jgi:tetratricopeptide (TPR) repeat protein
MHFIIFFLFSCLLIQTSFAQKPSKSQMQSEMNQFSNELNKQIADLEKQIAEKKKNKEDPETIKQLEGQVKMLKNQVSAMGSLNKTVTRVSDNSFQQATQNENEIVPKKDLARINGLPKKILSEAELFSFIKIVHAGVEKLVPASERTEALNIYNETRTEYKTTEIVANAANGCWMLGHWEKALIIMGKVCMDDITDADNLNNYASFLISTGGEQAAIPILEYLNSKYPENSTIINNLGQAWFGLGDIEKAKKYLSDATAIYPNHSMANNTLSQIAQSEGDNEKAISFLKASIKENYDAEKEGQLERLGGKLKYADMPEFNYPMQRDPFGIQAIIQSYPENFPSRIEDDERVNSINRYLNGANKLARELNDEMEMLGKKIVEDNNKLYADPAYQQEYLEPYNCPAYKLAQRSVLLVWEEKTLAGSAPLITQLFLPGFRSPADMDDLKTEADIMKECHEIWENDVLKPVADLAYAMRARINPMNASCQELDAAKNAYMAEEARIKKAGMLKIKQMVQQNSEAIDNWIKLNIYSARDNPPKNTDERVSDLVDQMGFTIRRKHYKDGVVYNFLKNAEGIINMQEYVKSSCVNDARRTTTDGQDELAWLQGKPVKCEFIKNINTPVVSYCLQCNTIKENCKGNQNLKKKKNNIRKGQGHSSNRRSQTRGPLSRSPRGPSSFFYDGEETIKVNDLKEPLTAEVKDPSQFSIEYDIWGNLVGLNFQLNDDGTALKDPDSIESAVDSRWSWNAIASPKKGVLNKLLIK